MNKIKREALKILSKHKVHSYAVSKLRKLATETKCLFDIDYVNKPYSYVFKRDEETFKIPIEPYDT